MIQIKDSKMRVFVLLSFCSISLCLGQLETSLFDVSGSGEGASSASASGTREVKQLSPLQPFNPWMMTIRDILASQEGE